MKKKLIITESQLERLKVILVENSRHQNKVAEIKQELDDNYEIVPSSIQKGGDYKKTTMFKIKLNDEIISAEGLLKYMKKYDASDKFVERVIRDWVDGNITDDYGLTENIPIGD